VITAVDYSSGDRAICSENSLMFLGSGTGQIGDGDRWIAALTTKPDPLSHPWVLEKAVNNDWILTTGEIERLLGVSIRAKESAPPTEVRGLRASNFS
jgi:hypothetical protein